jgi:hypothetical protein
LDPADVTISSAATSGAVGTGGVYAPNSGIHSANVNVADLVTALGGTNVTVTTTNTGVAAGGLGDIQVNAAVTWTAPTTLTLTAARDVRVNQAITGTGGSLVVNAGRDITVGAAVTTTTGSLGFTAAQDVNLNAATTITTGHLTAVGGRNVNVAAAATVTTGDMVFCADNDGTGPGVFAGTVNITCGANCLTITTGALRIRFNPVSYTSTNSEILDYRGKLTATVGSTLDAKAWVFGLGENKIYDGTNAANVSGLMPDLTSVAPPVSLGTVSNANFDTQHVGTDKPITFETTFSEVAHDLFSPWGTTPGSYKARADVLVRPLTVTAVTDTRVYNGTTSSVGTPTATGLQAGDTLNGALTQVFASKEVLGTGNSTLMANGAYTVSDGNGGNNYAVSVVTAPGSITPAPLTVTAQDVSKVYGQVPALTGFTTTALVNGETLGSVTLSSSGQAATAGVAGSPYAIAPSNAIGGTFTPGNYSIAYANGSLSVTPAPLTVKAQDVYKVFGQEPALTGFTTTGLVNGETVGSVTLISDGQAATAGVAGSPYAIAPSNATGGGFSPANYTVQYVNGALTVASPFIVPPVEPPVLPPVLPPVEPPVEPPVLPPVEPPVEPPVLPPVEPPVLPPVEPPVLPPVEPPVLPPVEPTVVPAEPPVTPATDLPVVDGGQAPPTVPTLEPQAARLTIAPLRPLTQGPVTLPPGPAPIAVAAVPPPTPFIQTERDKKEVAPPPAALAPVLPRVPFVPVRPLKQDRN